MVGNVAESDVYGQLRQKHLILDELHKYIFFNIFGAAQAVTACGGGGVFLRRHSNSVFLTEMFVQSVATTFKSTQSYLVPSVCTTWFSFAGPVHFMS